MPRAIALAATSARGDDHAPLPESDFGDDERSDRQRPDELYHDRSFLSLSLGGLVATASMGSAHNVQPLPTIRR